VIFNIFCFFSNPIRLFELYKLKALTCLSHPARPFFSAQALVASTYAHSTTVISAAETTRPMSSPCTSTALSRAPHSSRATTPFPAATFFFALLLLLHPCPGALAQGDEDVDTPFGVEMLGGAGAGGGATADEADDEPDYVRAGARTLGALTLSTPLAPSLVVVFVV